MENLGILNWRSWSAARKGAVLGAIAAAMVTMSVQGFICGMYRAGDEERRDLTFLVMATIGIPVNLPTELLIHATHWKVPRNLPLPLSLGGIVLTTTVNFFVYGGLGGAIGYSAHLLALLGRKLKRK